MDGFTANINGVSSWLLKTALGWDRAFSYPDGLQWKIADRRGGAQECCQYFPNIIEDPVVAPAVLTIAVDLPFLSCFMPRFHCPPRDRPVNGSLLRLKYSTVLLAG